MKRINNLYSKIYNIDNIIEADNKARRGKRKSYGVIKHDENKEYDNINLSFTLKNQNYHTSKYTTYKIYEPKERLIFRLPYYPDRITHHAIMNIMEPIWMKLFTRDTYSCIKGRGIHTLVQKLQKDLRKDPSRTTYCLKLDIRKFYPSIDHDVLKSIIRKKLKDKQVLQLLDEIIDSAQGVPIGNYLSQYFANLYLTYFDHWVKEILKVKYYYRYADDIVLLSDNKEQLREWFQKINQYLTNKLKLQIKSNYQIFPIESRGIDFVGYVCFHKYTKLRKSIKLKLCKLVRAYKNNKIDRDTFRRAMTSYAGWLKYCNSKHLLHKIEQETNIRYSGWKGIKRSLRNFKGKTLYVVNINPHKKYFNVYFIHNGTSYEIKSTSLRLYKFLIFLPKYPVLIKIT